MLVIVAKGFLKLPNLLMLKSKRLSLSRNLVLTTFGKLLVVFSTEVNLLYLLYFMGVSCCLLILLKQNCLLKTFLRTLILILIYNLKLYNILVSPMVVEKAITNLYLSKSSAPYFIPGLVLQKCDSIFKESCFPDYWEVSSVVPVFKNTGERFIGKS